MICLKNMCTKLFVVIVLMIILFYSFKDKDEPLDSDIKFMSRDELVNFFKTDPDDYFHTLTPINIRAYGYKTVDEYIKASCDDASDFTDDEKKYISSECKKGDDFLRNFNKIPYFPSSKVADIKWVLAKTNNNVYEKGYPHTRLNIIFLPKDILKSKKLAQTLVHEKVHVYSRLFPEDMSKWNEKNGYILYRKLKEYPLARSNPDVDGLVYLDKNKRETLAQYTTRHPTSIEQAKYPYGDDYKTEHPNEVLAYQVDGYM